MSDCYIGRKPCGCVVTACVDNPEHVKDTAKEVARWLRQGLTVERQSVEWAREHLKPCKCGKAAGP